MTEVERVREIFEEVIQTPGYAPMARFGKFMRDQVAVLFEEIDRKGATMETVKQVRQRWEYLRAFCRIEKSETELKRYGEEGWELAAVTRDGDGWYNLFFKRPL